MTNQFETPGTDPATDDPPWSIYDVRWLRRVLLICLWWPLALLALASACIHSRLNRKETVELYREMMIAWAEDWRA